MTLEENHGKTQAKVISEKWRRMTKEEKLSFEGTLCPICMRAPCRMMQQCKQ